MEDQFEDSKGISFVEDVTRVAVEGDNIDDVARKLERCAEGSLCWAEENVVWLEASKTEAILFSRNGALEKEKQERNQPRRPMSLALVSDWRLLVQ